MITDELLPLKVVVDMYVSSTALPASESVKASNWLVGWLVVLGLTAL